MPTLSRGKSAALLAARGGMLALSALLLSYLESFIPINLIIPLPGFKLGLANILVMLIFFTFSPLEALAVSACRIILSALLFGSPVSLFFSACGGALSLAGLLALKYTLVGKLSFFGISIVGAALHNTGQLIAASLLFGGGVFYYLPVMLIASLIFGGICGIILNIIYPKLGKVIKGGGHR